MSKKAIPIKKADYARVILTETLPSETPVIFSNLGLYERLQDLDNIHPVQRALLKALVLGETQSKSHSTIPFLYKIRKDSHSYRRLGLLHPRSQWKIKEFYEKYESLILYHCSHSPASIRAPKKVAGSFYLKSSIENLNKYKTGSVSLLTLDNLTKHTPTFFSYYGYNRLYKFFESKDYFELEKFYTFMLTLDVSKCFDSIYTHTMSWAVKDKAFTKKNVGVSATFAQEFDVLMAHANHNETNGIVIGPEVSRIFAEIIFQEIDRSCIERLKVKKQLIFGQDYTFRRYVDDVYIFAHTKEMAYVVYEIYCESMQQFNLHANDKKSDLIERPFVTEKSRLIHAASIELTSFESKFLIRSNISDSLTPLPIRSVWNLTRSFIEGIKSICSHNNVNYDEVSSFIISVLSERIKKIVEVDGLIIDNHASKDYKNAFLVLLDILFFLYKISPSVGASYKLCTSIILIIRFCRKYLPDIQDTISQRIYELSSSLLNEHIVNPNAVDAFIPLEVLNVILTVKELGRNYLMPEATVRKMFLTSHGQTYFSIISCLFYVQTEPQYAEIRNEIISLADLKLKDLADIHMNSEKAYLLLDLMTCTFIPETVRLKWINRAYSSLGIPLPAKPQTLDYLNNSLKTHVQINWSDDVDLLNSLEKKELKLAY